MNPRSIDHLNSIDEIPTALCCVLHRGSLGIGTLGQTPVKWAGAGRHWVDGSSPGQESRGSFAAAAGSAWCSP